MRRPGRAGPRRRPGRRRSRAAHHGLGWGQEGVEPRRRSSREDPPGGGLNLLEAEPLTVTRAGTNALDMRPIGGGLNVLAPERPGLALNRPRGVDGAAGLLVPEDAVSPR